LLKLSTSLWPLADGTKKQRIKIFSREIFRQQRRKQGSNYPCIIGMAYFKLTDSEKRLQFCSFILDR
jgi:hypothetical protein